MAPCHAQFFNVDFCPSMSTSFPLITLSPVSDPRNAWAALALEAAAPFGDGVLDRLFDEFGLGAALGPLPCVIALPDLALDVAALPAERIVLRLPVALCCERGHDDALHALRARGFRLMATGLPAPGQALCDGVDSLALSCSGANIPAGTCSWLRKLPGPHMAVDVGTMACPGRCPFHWLARHHTDAPRPAAAGRGCDAPNRLLLLELLSQVANDADSHDIEATIKRDPQLSYHLLKLVNSVAFSLTAKIASFNQAITLLGRRQLQRWLQLLLYARSHDGDEANPLLPRAALRAGLAEALCAAGGGSRDDQDRAFMVGMFSLLGALFGIPLAEVVKPLNLADDVQGALMQRGGPLGVLLRACEAGEAPSGNEDLAAILAEAHLSHEDWARSLIHACGWAVQISREA